MRKLLLLFSIFCLGLNLVNAQIIYTNDTTVCASSDITLQAVGSVQDPLSLDDEYSDGKFEVSPTKKKLGRKSSKLEEKTFTDKFKLGAGFYSSSSDVTSRISQPIIIENSSIGKSKNQLKNIGNKSKSEGELMELITSLNIEMKQAAENLDFERAAQLRDKIFELESNF